MIPWFIARIVGVIVRPFGYQVMVRARFGAFGVDRIFVQRPGQFSPEIEA